MNEHVYITSFNRIFRQSFFVWLFLILSICISLGYRINLWNSSFFLILVDIFLWAVTIAGLYLHFNYLKFSINKQLVISADSVKIIDISKNTTIQIAHTDIDSIINYSCMGPGRLPWSNHEYVCIISKDNRKIIVPSYITNLMTFRFDKFGVKISKASFHQVKKYLPVIEQCI